jgi:hypothetical protein
MVGSHGPGLLALREALLCLGEGRHIEGISEGHGQAATSLSKCLCTLLARYRWWLWPLAMLILP